MKTCQYPGCTNSLPEQRGPRRMYCDIHRREKQKQIRREYYRKNREKYMEVTRKFREKNPTYTRDWQRSERAKNVASMAYVRQVEAELGIHHPTETCRRCGKKLLPVHKRELMSYCCRECYMAMFRGNRVTAG